MPEIYAKFKEHWIEQQSDAENGSVTKIWNRRNAKNLTALTLAADLGRSQMLSWLIEERKQIQWSYGDISCVLYPLEQLDLDLQTDVGRKILKRKSIRLNFSTHFR